MDIPRTPPVLRGNGLQTFSDGPEPVVGGPWALVVLIYWNLLNWQQAAGVCAPIPDTDRHISQGIPQDPQLHRSKVDTL